MKPTTTDSNGKDVKEGDYVRVLSISPATVEKLSKKEKEDVMSMLGHSFQIEEVDEYGNAWVTKWWDRGRTNKESHSLALSPSEMILVDEDGRT